MAFSMAGLYLTDKLGEKLDPANRTAQATPPLAANALEEPATRSDKNVPRSS